MWTPEREAAARARAGFMQGLKVLMAASTAVKKAIEKVCVCECVCVCVCECACMRVCVCVGVWPMPSGVGLIFLHLYDKSRSSDEEDLTSGSPLL